MPRNLFHSSEIQFLLCHFASIVTSITLIYDCHEHWVVVV